MRRSVWIVLIIFFTLFSLAPSIYELTRINDLQPNRSFELVHNFPTDYNFYLSRIREGLEGRWTAVERYTAEPHEGSLIHEAYILMGEVGRFARVPPGRAGDVYHIARSILGLAFVLSIAWFALRTFSQKRYRVWWIPILAFLLAISASSWPKLLAVVDGSIIPATLKNLPFWRFGGYMPWWSVMDSLQRITFIPHLLIGQIGILVCVFFLTQESVLWKKGNSVLLGIGMFFLGMVFPPGLLFLYAFMGLWFLFHIRTWKRWLLPFLSIGILSIPSLLYLSLMTTMYPWKRLAEVDIIRPIHFDYGEYFEAVGPVFPLGIMGLLLAVTSRTEAFYPAVTWVLTWLVLLGLFAFVPQQSPLRFSEMIPHVPLAFLTLYLFSSFGKIKAVGKYWVLFPFIIIGIGMFQMYSSYMWQKDFIDHKIRATYPLVPTGSYVMYPLKDFIGAMQILDVRTPKDAVILSESTAGNYIPVVAGRTVYAGHDNTVKFEEKKIMVEAFFSGKMNAQEALIWLRTIRAHYIYFGPQEKDDGGITDLTRVYPFLTPMYENATVTLYQVN